MACRPRGGKQADKQDAQEVDLAREIVNRGGVERVTFCTREVTPIETRGRGDRFGGWRGEFVHGQVILCNVNSEDGCCLEDTEHLFWSQGRRGVRSCPQLSTLVLVLQVCKLVTNKQDFRL